MLRLRKSMSVKPKDFAALPEYYDDGLKRVMAGDVVVRIQEQGKKDNWVPHHCSLVSIDRRHHVQSANWGVFTSSLSDGPAVVFRAPGGELRKPTPIGAQAARIAQAWVNDDDYAWPTHRTFGEEPQTTRAAFGYRNFGKLARERLVAYRSGENKPENITCSELCVLAYQVAVWHRQSPWWIPLDASHTAPWSVERWLQSNWDCVGRILDCPAPVVADESATFAHEAPRRATESIFA